MISIETVSSWGVWSCQAQRLRWVLSAQASWSKLVSSQIQVSKWWSKVYVRNCLLNSQCSGWDKKQKRRWKRDVRRSTSRCFCLRALMSRFCASSWSGLNGTANFFWEDALARQQQASKPATPKEAAKQIQLHCCDLGLVNQHHCLCTGWLCHEDDEKDGFRAPDSHSVNAQILLLCIVFDDHYVIPARMLYT